MLKIAARACQEAGLLAKKHFKKKIKTSHKGPFDLVTDIDYQCEKLILEKIQRKYPSHSIVSEEKGTIEKKSEYTWIVDPLDGTINYARGIAYFGNSIAIVRDKKDPVIGVVYDPLQNELFYAEKGKGAFLNHKKIKVSGISLLSDAIVATDFTTQKKFMNRQYNLDMMISHKIMGLRMMNANSINMGNLASGRFDAYIKVNVNFEDFAAGVVLVEEAGGKVTDIYGKPFERDSTSILMSNGILHKKLLALFG